MKLTLNQLQDVKIEPQKKDGTNLFALIYIIINYVGMKIIEYRIKEQFYTSKTSTYTYIENYQFAGTLGTHANSRPA